MLGDLGGHPCRLAAQVGIVGAGLDAGGDQLVAIKLVRADRGENDLGARTHGFKVGIVIGIGDHQRRGGRRTDQIAHFLELGEAAACHRPLRRVGAAGIVVREIFGDEAAGVAGGAIDDDVEFAGCGHGVAVSVVVGALPA